MRILLAEDDDSLRGFLARALELQEVVIAAMRLARVLAAHAGAGGVDRAAALLGVEETADLLEMLILLLAREGFESEEITDFAGLNQRSPLYAGVMAVCMFSLAGIPPMVGFYAKLSVLQALIASSQASYIGLAVFAVMMSLIGAFYYLRVVKVMYFDEPAAGASMQPGQGGGVSAGSGAVQPLPSRSIQIGLVIAYGVTTWVVSGTSGEASGRLDRSSPDDSAVISTDASSGGNSTGVTTGNMFTEPVTSATTQLSRVSESGTITS